MTYENLVRQAYRLYAVTLVIWAAWSGVWLGTNLNIEANMIGIGWLVIAIFGIVVATAMGLTRIHDEVQLFKTQSNRDRIRRFNNHAFGGVFLNLYVIALAAWSFLTIEWVTINLGLVGRTIIGGGWLVIALYGAALTIGLTAKHKDDIVEEVENVTPTALETEP